MLLESLATTARIGDTVGSKSWKHSNTTPEFAFWNIRFPSESVCISNAWYSLSAYEGSWITRWIDATRSTK
jgi:hypothetical protein